MNEARKYNVDRRTIERAIDLYHEKGEDGFVIYDHD
jgi:hypothetical protein